jgi:hypothetical protein
MIPKIKHKGLIALTQMVWWSFWNERNKRILHAHEDWRASLPQSWERQMPDQWLLGGRRRVRELLEDHGPVLLAVLVAVIFKTPSLDYLFLLVLCS